MSIWIGFGRYMAPVFPIFIVLAILARNPHVFAAICFISTLLLALLSLFYSHFYWTS